MIATNHYLAGSIIGASMPPAYAVPAALASHFLMDILPHYGIDHLDRNHSTVYQRIVIADVAATIAIAYVLLIFNQWAMFWIGWVALSPDFAWGYLHLKSKGDYHIKPKHRFLQWHHNIQIYERSWGIAVDIATAVILFFIMLIVLGNNL